MKARAEGGRRQLDERCSLPAGTVLDLALDDEGDDLRVVRAHFTDDQLRQALRAGLPGVFDARSWAYWHAVLGVDPVPPLPARRLPG